MKKIIIILVVFMTTCIIFAEEQREMRLFISGNVATNNPKIFVTAGATLFNLVKNNNSVITFGVLYAPTKWFDIKVATGFQTVKKIWEMSAFLKFIVGKFVWRSRVTADTTKDLQFESFALYCKKYFSIGIETDRISFGADEEHIRAFGPHIAVTTSKNLIVAVTIFFTHHGPVTRGYVTISL
jgi:hypothetical protein